MQIPQKLHVGHLCWGAGAALTALSSSWSYPGAGVADFVTSPRLRRVGEGFLQQSEAGSTLAVALSLTASQRGAGWQRGTLCLVCSLLLARQLLPTCSCWVGWPRWLQWSLNTRAEFPAPLLRLHFIALKAPRSTEQRLMLGTKQGGSIQHLHPSSFSERQGTPN